MTKDGNLFSEISERLQDEQVTELFSRPDLRIERIVSRGQASPPGFWYDQDWDEWVVLFAGTARLLFDGEDDPRKLAPGDFIHIPAHKRHRVEWTSPGETTVWLAVHFR